jgi:predicted dienelactone hydrolase
MENSAGCMTAQLVDEATGAIFPMLVMYPSAVPEKTERLGPYSLALAAGAAPIEGKFPLVLISHGTGGSHLAYRTLARHLARNGFVVGMPEHPFNNRNDNSLEGTALNLANRPRHLHTAIDWFYGSAEFCPLLKPDAVSLIGHSMGGYTALALAGGTPTSFPNESPDGQARQVEVAHDPRVKALVLLAPAAAWFRAEGALRAVDVPILLLAGEKDEVMPVFAPHSRYSYHAWLILKGVAEPAKITHRIVHNAGHFAFLSPFPAAMSNAMFPPSQDPPGFDREQFQLELQAEVLEFLLPTPAASGVRVPMN